jgi:hypothetical protein
VTSKRKGQIILGAFMILLDVVQAKVFKANRDLYGGASLGTFCVLTRIR